MKLQGTHQQQQGTNSYQHLQRIQSALRMTNQLEACTVQPGCADHLGASGTKVRESHSPQLQVE